MKFSIIVPVYNTEKYISACIESVLKQTYNNYELILIDDGSTDSSGKICDEYSKNDNRIRVFHKKNSGQIESRCYGVARSQGDFVIFLDSDDLLAENALRVIHKKIVYYKCNMVIYSYERFGDSPKRNYQASYKNDILISDKKDLYIRIFSDELYNSLCIKAVEKRFIRTNICTKFNEVRYGEDLLQTIDIIKQNPKTVVIEDVLYYYRTNMNSMTQSIRLERYAFDIMFVRNAAYECLTEECMLDANEIYNYRGRSIDMLVGGIASISRYKCEFTKKKKIFDEIKQSPYYKNFLCTDKYNRKCLGRRYIIWFLFQKNFYKILEWLYCVKDCCSRWF